MDPETCERLDEDETWTWLRRVSQDGRRGFRRKGVSLLPASRLSAGPEIGLATLEGNGPGFQYTETRLLTSPSSPDRCTTLTLHALGAAIPLCLSLALAIRDAIPGGEPTGDDPNDAEMNGQEEEEPLVKLEVVTGSKDVHDEITPDDEVRLLTRHSP